jgi:succinate dehydrogenase / fumarate reductase membrane anchor subunit
LDGRIVDGGLKMMKSDTRTPISRASGLGSAKSGIGHWWAQRISAVALIPLSLWFAASIIAHVGDDYAEVFAWLQSPLSAVLMTLLVAALFYHVALGLQTIIEDYFHSALKFAALVLFKLLSIALAIIGIAAIAKIAFAT